SLSRGAGLGTSFRCRTSGAPYCVYTTAFIDSPSRCADPDLQACKTYYAYVATAAGSSTCQPREWVPTRSTQPLELYHEGQRPRLANRVPALACPRVQLGSMYIASTVVRETSACSPCRLFASVEPHLSSGTKMHGSDAKTGSSYYFREFIR